MKIDQILKLIPLLAFLMFCSSPQQTEQAEAATQQEVEKPAAAGLETATSPLPQETAPDTFPTNTLAARFAPPTGF